MRLLKKLSNLIFGTQFDTDVYVMPSKQRLIQNMYREYAHRDWD